MIQLKIGIILVLVSLSALSWVEAGGPLAVRASEQVVSAARRRNQQVPLPHAQALVLAEVARGIGDQESERAFLERAIDSPVYGELARIKLAEVLIGSDADKAALLVVPTLEKAGTHQLRRSAVGVARKSILRGLSADVQASVEKAVTRLPRSSRRAIEAVAADPKSSAGRQALRRLLERDQGDLAALDAAYSLQGLSDLSRREQWLVAGCLYRHALYLEASPILERLATSQSKDVPSSEVSFLRGRCGFRLDRWAEAEAWYQRALKTVTSQTRKAELQVHIARTRELDGNIEGAVEMARRSVITKASDDRRLFLVRLRLRQGRLDMAEAGIANLRTSSSKARGRLLMALNELAAGRTESGLSMLEKVRVRPWRGPARVVAAGELVNLGRAEGAIGLLERASGELNTYWQARAQKIMAKLPQEVIVDWRSRQETKVQAGGPNAARDLGKWAALEFDSKALVDIQAHLVAVRSIGSPVSESLVGGLAGHLRSIGLDREAVRWDSGSFPSTPEEQGLWSAHQFLAGGSPWLAIRTADAVWRRWGANVPVRAYPAALLQALYPLLDFDQVTKAAKAGGIDWEIVAGVAREESRWNPEVLSRVGARGLMQLMPLTAATVAARLGTTEPTPAQLFRPDWSLNLGAAELARLNRKFDGFTAAAVAAYNAGEAQSRLWLDQCGHNCDESRFVLTITFNATRKYSQDVMSSAETYRKMFPGPTEIPN